MSEAVTDAGDAVSATSNLTMSEIGNMTGNRDTRGLKSQAALTG